MIAKFPGQWRGSKVQVSDCAVWFPRVADVYLVASVESISLLSVLGVCHLECFMYD